MNANGKVIQHRYPHCVIREFVVWEKGRVVYVLDSYGILQLLLQTTHCVYTYMSLKIINYCFGSVFWARNLSAGRLTKSWVCKHCIMWTQGSGTVQWKLHVGKIAYVMNQNDRLVSNDNFFGRWIDVSIKNLQPKPTSCQVSIVFIALMLYFFYLKKNEINWYDYESKMISYIYVTNSPIVFRAMIIQKGSFIVLCSSFTW